jgi:hypothetical protein
VEAKRQALALDGFAGLAAGGGKLGPAGAEVGASTSGTPTARPSKGRWARCALRRWARLTSPAWLTGWAGKVVPGGVRSVFRREQAMHDPLVVRRGSVPLRQGIGRVEVGAAFGARRLSLLEGEHLLHHADTPRRGPRGGGTDLWFVDSQTDGSLTEVGDNSGCLGLET